MKILIIDSHKSVARKFSHNLHLQNAKIIADKIGAKLIWSYKGVNEEIEDNFDVIIFNHSSFYSFIDFEWIERSPNAKLFYIVNEYNCGEPHALWNAVKRLDRKYTVIANHPPNISKIVTKYTDAWHQVNLNALVFNPDIVPSPLSSTRSGGIYYGSFRKGRAKYFKKYLDGVLVSTHVKNREKYSSLEIQPQFINRIDWAKEGLFPYKTSLYIEDEINHTNYNHLANRFYEALNYNVVPLFDDSCAVTVSLSDYHVPTDYFIGSKQEFAQKNIHLPVDHKLQLEIWREQATFEKQEVLQQLEKLLTNV